MTIYQIVLFLHVAGMLGLVAALGIEWVLLHYAARTTNSDEAQAYIRPTVILPPLAVLSSVLVLASGVYLGIHIHAGEQAWVRVSLIALLFIAVLGIFTGARMRALRRARSIAEIRALTNDTRLQTPIRIRFSVLLGIVFIMVARTDLVLSLSVVGATLAIGLVWSLPTWKARGRVAGSV